MDEREMVFIDALLYAMEGKDPSKAIENQERRGQQSVVRNIRLPKKVNDHSVPREFLWKGVKDSMEWKEKYLILERNNEIYTRSIYEKLGIEILSDSDDLFYNVKLPNGWEIKPTDHHMWNDLYDDKGRKRAKFFYKAAFYDRSAFINFCTRFSVRCVPFDNYESDVSYEEREVKPWYGVIYDGDKEIYRTKGEVSSDGSVKSYDIERNQIDIVTKRLKEEYPDWENILAYWD